MKIPDCRIDSQPYELFMFARRHGIELEHARAILNQHSANRAGSDAAAMALKEMTLDVRNSLASDELLRASSILNGAGCREPQAVAPPPAFFFLAEVLVPTQIERHSQSAQIT